MANDPVFLVALIGHLGIMSTHRAQRYPRSQRGERVRFKERFGAMIIQRSCEEVEGYGKRARRRRGPGSTCRGESAEKRGVEKRVQCSGEMTQSGNWKKKEFCWWGFRYLAENGWGGAILVKPSLMELITVHLV